MTVLANPALLAKGNKPNAVGSYTQVQHRLSKADNIFKPQFCRFLVYQLRVRQQIVSHKNKNPHCNTVSKCPINPHFDNKMPRRQHAALSSH